MFKERIQISNSSRIGIYYFACSLCGVVLFGVSICQGLSTLHTNDFRQYYGGALVVGSGDWDALYPAPIPGGTRNAGMDAVPNAKYVELSQKAGIAEPENYIQPPTCALLYFPLYFLDYPTAEWAWRLLTTLAVCLSALIAGRIARVLSGSSIPTLSEIITICLICLSVGKSVTPLTVGNVSPIVGFVIASGVLAIIYGRTTVAAAMFGVAALLKVSPLLLLAVIWLRCDRRRLVGAVTFGLLLLALSLLITGIDVWIQFVSEIAPTLGRPWLPRPESTGSTISLYGVAWQFYKQDPLPPVVNFSLKALSIGGLIVLLLLMAWRTQFIRSDVRMAVAAAGCLIVWPLITAPLFWGHYGYYYTCLTGWLVAECYLGGWKRAIFSAATLFFMWGPWGRLPPFSDSGLLSSFVPLGVAILILGLSVSILLVPPIPQLKSESTNPN